MFRRLLIANRGEIAVRVIRVCREMGISPIAVYSDADAQAMHVRMADEAYAIGPAPASESYLRIDRIVETAKKAGADAVHPGYGFLSENPDFAQAVADAGLVFVGPTPRAMRSLGLKTEARKLVQAAGVPVVPGTLDPVDSLEEVRRIATEVGFPVALKAVAGGGGKGLRIVRDPANLDAAFRQATSEAGAAFGNPAVYVEKAIERPRHVEVQILGDQHGQYVSLGERDCSLQRRHQKVIEESPSPAVSPNLREQMGDVAVRAARAAGYTNAGTVEFLLSPDGSFYFLEVNARIQVEHPVTERVMGLDLLRQQIRIAAGERIEPWVMQPQPRGYAIECRIYAEDAAHNFMPSTGRIVGYRPPGGPGVRVDSGVEAGSEIGVHYDPMIAKLVVWSPARQFALPRMERALREFLVLGVTTNIPLHLWILQNEDFRSGNVDTGWLDRVWDGSQVAEVEEPNLELAAVAAAVMAETRPRIVTGVGLPGASADGATQPPSSWRQAARRAALE